MIFNFALNYTYIALKTVMFSVSHFCFSFDWLWPPMLVLSNHLIHATLLIETYQTLSCILMLNKFYTSLTLNKYKYFICRLRFTVLTVKYFIEKFYRFLFYYNINYI